MNLSLKKSPSHWLVVGQNEGKEVKFLIDYPSRIQQEKLEELKYDAWGKFIQTAQEDGKMKIDGLKIDLVKFLKYKRYILKFAIKDWEGLEEKCLLVNGELEDELWWALVRDENKTNQLYELVFPEIDFNEVDKKKLSTVDSLSEKAD